MKKKARSSATFRLCVIAMMMALYIVLTRFFSIHMGNLRITFGSLPIILTAMLFGPLEASLTAFLGEFLLQLTSYGLTATTVLWCIPPVIRALIVGFGWRRFRQRSSADGQDDVKHIRLSFQTLMILLILSAVAVTICNTLVIWADSVIYGYYSQAYVFGQFLARLMTGVVTAVLMGSVSLPLEKALKRFI